MHLDPFVSVDGLPFVPTPERWVTALAAHCMATWREMGAAPNGGP